MAKGTEKESNDKPSYWRELFRARLYKRTQGRITRQVTFAAIALAFALGAWQGFNALVPSAWLTSALNTAAQAIAPAAVESVRWEAGSAGSVAAARARFVELREQGYRAFESQGGERLAEFPVESGGEAETAGSVYLERQASAPRWVRYLAALGLPLLMLAAGSWAAFRLVSYPPFADFLIAVEAEMNKVSWPARGELIRSSMVVIVVIFSLALLLFAYDAAWKFVLGPDVLGIIYR